MATTPILGLPVVGPLHPLDWVRPAGNTDMKVTQDAAQHHAKLSATTGLPAPMALDIGDGAPDLDTLFAPHAGTVAQALTVGSANLSIDWMEGAVKWRAVLAHNTLPHPVKVGQVLAEGATVGRMGHTSIPSMPVALHLHLQVGWWNGSAFVWVDPWPLFAQNQKDTDMLQGTLISRIVNKKTSILGMNTNFRASPATGTTPILAKFPTGTLFMPDFDVTGQANGASTRWFAGFLDVNGVQTLGYLHESVVGPLTDAAAAGHTDAELATAASDAAAANESKWENWIGTHP